MSPATVALVGSSGYGAWHLANLRRLQASGRLRIVGLCDPRTPSPATLAGLAGVPVYADVAQLYAGERPDITVVASPPHTHADIASAALTAGSHVLLEKPPATTLADHERLSELQERSGKVVQVGFQSLGSEALEHARGLIEQGAVGTVLGIGVAGSWVRDADYFSRSPWAGRRVLDGVPVVDGALTNPFGHATATALRLDAAEERGRLRTIDVELFRANAIESDDTSCLTATTINGTRIVVAVTLCAERDRQPYLVVSGTEGRIRFEYKTHRLEVERAGQVDTSHHGCVDLLENLLDHLEDPEIAPVAPLAATGAFMEVLERVRTAPDPLPIAEAHVDVLHDRGAPRRLVRGIDEAVDRCARELVSFTDLDLPWVPTPDGARRSPEEPHRR